jgi:competence ComEA-like helix-hairpin-helix protein
MNASENNLPEAPAQESFARRLKLVLWKEHQPFILLLLVCCLIGMVAYFWIHSIVTGGLIDIDQAAPKIAEFKIDINTAEWPEIVVLPGVGEKLAKAIVDHRQSAGSFQTLDAIQEVSGIGEKKFEQLLPFLHPIQDR